jgi:hypothetical protein
VVDLTDIVIANSIYLIVKTIPTGIITETFVGPPPNVPAAGLTRFLFGIPAIDCWYG